MRCSWVVARLAVMVPLSILPCCGAEPTTPEDDAGKAVEAMVVGNAIVPNAIVPNAIVPNAIVPNAIVPNALSSDALDATSLSALRAAGERGALSRMFLQYTVSCALDATQSLSFDWTDEGGAVHQETYVGLVGLAPSWATSPLARVSKQRMVSACLAARANYYGVSVGISMRSRKDPLDDTLTHAELRQYPTLEGSFWGNVFAENPRVHACYEAKNVTRVRSLYRDCAAGHVAEDGSMVGCGPIEITGPCATACADFDAQDGTYAWCSAPDGGTSAVVITTGLL